MHLNIEIPAHVEALLQKEWGDLSRAAQEALAIESYRTGKISLGVLAEMLGMGVIQADDWLAHRNVPLQVTTEDLEADRRDLAESFPEIRR